MDITFSKEWENSFLEKMGKFYYPRKYSILERMAKTHSVFMNGNWTFKIMDFIHSLKNALFLVEICLMIFEKLFFSLNFIYF